MKAIDDLPRSLEWSRMLVDVEGDELETPERWHTQANGQSEFRTVQGKTDDSARCKLESTLRTVNSPHRAVNMYWSGGGEVPKQLPA